jgi:short-subunit dehydrogenase
MPRAGRFSEFWALRDKVKSKRSVSNEESFPKREGRRRESIWPSRSQPKFAKPDGARHELALVTGASSGLGKALSQVLAKQKIPLILVARNEEKLKKIASDLPVSSQIYKADLADPEQRKELIKLIHRQKPDLIVNNAGFGLYGPTLIHPLSDLNAMVELNIRALMELSVESARALLKEKRKGTILNISSAASFFPTPSFCLYSATKAFVNNFSEGLDGELRSHGIRVLTICPGQIDTDFRKRASGDYPQKKDKITMSPEKAAELILKQIDKGKPLSIIDWRYRVAVGLAKLLPKQLVQTLMKRSLDKRHDRSG